MRLIDADKLIAWIKESQQMTSKMRNIICKIESMPDAVEWIPVTERLPKHGQDVLAWVETEQRIACCHYANGRWCDAILDRMVKPIAWMPLPEPYEAKGETDCPWK